MSERPATTCVLSGRPVKPDRLAVGGNPAAAPGAERNTSINSQQLEKRLTGCLESARPMTARSANGNASKLGGECVCWAANCAAVRPRKGTPQ